MESQENALMTVTEAAEYLRVRQNTLRIWIREGKIPSVRSPVSDSIRLLRKDVESFFRVGQ